MIKNVHETYKLHKKLTRNNETGKGGHVMEVVGGLRAEIRVNSPKLPGIAAFSRSAVWLGVVHDQQHTSLEQRAPYDVGS